MLCTEMLSLLSLYNMCQNKISVLFCHILRWYKWDYLYFVNKHRSSWPLLGL